MTLVIIFVWHVAPSHSTTWMSIAVNTWLGFLKHVYNYFMQSDNSHQSNPDQWFGLLIQSARQTYSSLTNFYLNFASRKFCVISQSYRLLFYMHCMFNAQKQSWPLIPCLDLIWIGHFDSSYQPLIKLIQRLIKSAWHLLLILSNMWRLLNDAMDDWD